MICLWFFPETDKKKLENGIWKLLLNTKLSCQAICLCFWADYSKFNWFFSFSSEALEYFEKHPVRVENFQFSTIFLWEVFGENFMLEWVLCGRKAFKTTQEVNLNLKSILKIQMVENWDLGESVYANRIFLEFDWSRLLGILKKFMNYIEAENLFFLNLRKIEKKYLTSLE